MLNSIWASLGSCLTYVGVTGERSAHASSLLGDTDESPSSGRSSRTTRSSAKMRNSRAMRSECWTAVLLERVVCLAAILFTRPNIVYINRSDLDLALQWHLTQGHSSHRGRSSGTIQLPGECYGIGLDFLSIVTWKGVGSVGPRQHLHCSLMGLSEWFECEVWTVVESVPMLP